VSTSFKNVVSDGCYLFVVGFHSSTMFLAKKQVYVEQCLGMFPPVFFALFIPDDVLEERKQKIRNMLEAGLNFALPSA
jgi:hypothetical protein